jgi:hypothetical protein
MSFQPHESGIHALQPDTGRDRVTGVYSRADPEPTAASTLTGTVSQLPAPAPLAPEPPVPGPPAPGLPQSDGRAGISFQRAAGFRPHAAAANTVSTKSTNVMACTLVQ